MSAFNPHNYKTSAAVWQEIAKDTNEETGAQFTIIGGVVLGLFAAAAASPITGLLVAGYFGYKAWQDTQAANRNEEAIDSYGCVAHLLRAGDLRDYTRQVGVDTAIQEITWAVENGYRVSSPALDLLESQGVDVDALVDPPALPAAPVEDAKKSEPPLDFLANEIELLAVKDAAMPTPSVSPNQVEPIPTPETFDIPIEEMPVLQPPVTTDDKSSTFIDDRFSWTKDLLNFPAVLIWGAQGSGKTSFTAWLLRERIKAGHTAEVWDVHREFGQWDGLPVFGDGMDYEAIDRRMLAFERQVKADYQKRATDPKYSPKRHTVVCEELTNFARRCEHSAPFFEASLSDLRKVRKGVIFVSHGRSLTTLGGSQGFAQTRNSGLLELQLEAKIDPATGDPIPAMRGKLKLPGKAAIEVEISTEMNGSMDFTASVTQPTQPQPDARATLENIFRTSEAPRPGPETFQAGEEVSTTSGNEESQQESGFPASNGKEENFQFEDFQLGRALFLAVRVEMEKGKGKAAIVQEVLECPGRKYKYGCAWFDALMQKHGGKQH